MAVTNADPLPLVLRVAIGVAIALPLDVFWVMLLEERRLSSPAALSDTSWTLYLDHVPGHAARCRGPGEAAFHEALDDGQTHFVCVVPRAPGPPRGIVPVDIEYTSWFGLTRRVAYRFDVTAWDDGKMWIAYYSSGYDYVREVTDEGHDHEGRVEFSVQTTPLTTVRYSFDSDAVDRVLPEGVSSLDLPPGARSITTCMSGRTRETELVRTRFVRAPERNVVLSGRICP